MPKLGFDKHHYNTGSWRDNSLLYPGLITDAVLNILKWGFVVKFSIIHQAWNCITSKLLKHKPEMQLRFIRNQAEYLFICFHVCRALNAKFPVDGRNQIIGPITPVSRQAGSAVLSRQYILCQGLQEM
jgi:hypothetical protein